MSQHHCNTSNMCAAQTCRSQSCSHSRSRKTYSHAPFQADHRGCKNRLFSPHQDKSSPTRSAWILYGKTFKNIRGIIL